MEDVYWCMYCIVWIYTKNTWKTKKKIYFHFVLDLFAKNNHDISV